MKVAGSLLHIALSGGKYYTHRALNTWLVERVSVLKTVVLFRLCHGHVSEKIPGSPHVYIFAFRSGGAWERG